MATSGSRFVSFTSVANPNMRIRNNPFAAKDAADRMLARKITIARGCIGFRYQSSVRRQQAREGKAKADFVAGPRKWGSRIKGTPLVSHTGGPDGRQLLYLEVKIEHRGEKYFDRNTGQSIPLETIQPHLRSCESRQPIRRPVILRDYRLTNLAELTLDGTRYTIAPAAAELQTYFPTRAPAVATARQKASHKGQRGKGAVA